MKIFFSKSWLRAWAGLSINLSAAWFVAAFITPNFSSLENIDGIISLTKDLLLGTVFLAMAALIERRISNNGRK